MSTKKSVIGTWWSYSAVISAIFEIELSSKRILEYENDEKKQKRTKVEKWKEGCRAKGYLEINDLQCKAYWTKEFLLGTAKNWEICNAKVLITANCVPRDIHRLFAKYKLWQSFHRILITKPIGFSGQWRSISIIIKQKIFFRFLMMKRGDKCEKQCWLMNDKLKICDGSKH